MQRISVEWFELLVGERHLGDAEFAHIHGGAVPGHIFDHFDLARFIMTRITAAHFFLAKDPGQHASPGHPEGQVGDERLADLGAAAHIPPNGHIAA